MKSLEVVKHDFHALKSYEAIAELLSRSGKTHILYMEKIQCSSFLFLN